MKPFLKKFFLVYALPVIIYFAFVIVLDPLKCFRSYHEYYNGSFVPPNRENVCLNLLENSKSPSAYNSFILGNSCSHAFKTSNWIPYLPKGSKGFHLDAYRENLYGILKKLEYLEKKGNKISNALIMIDRSVFSKKFGSYMYVIPKELDPDSSKFYTEQLKALTSVRFVVSYTYYYIFHKNLPFMEGYGFTDSLPRSDNTTGDLFYLSDDEIKRDSVKFFNEKKNQNWVKRIDQINLVGNDSFEGMTEKNINYLKKIREILVRNNCNYKIVINPLYNQEILPEKELETIQSIFGKTNVFNFSGANELTSDFTNFYDGIHYRPPVANRILQKIYMTEIKSLK